ncbi:hypothetical protein BB558_007390 [Smittium angustum]|uniref:Uncharacterized protein n=1 Tax=Smittium angustum TaxID=133377 RepID=A0A2U1IV63_SMIAN|nr:hypothetical protein BB558_007390 [Smittium angustum]
MTRNYKARPFRQRYQLNVQLVYPTANAVPAQNSVAGNQNSGYQPSFQGPSRVCNETLCNAKRIAINPTLVFNENSETIGQQNLGDYPKGDSITIVKESNHDSFNYIKRVLFKSVLCPKGNWRATSSFGLTQPQQPYRKAQFQDGNAPNSKQVDSTSELDGQCRSKGRFSSCTYQQEISKIPTLHMGKEPFSIQNFAFRHNTKPLCVYKNIAFNDTMSEGTWNKDSVILRQ